MPGFVICHRLRKVKWRIRLSRAGCVVEALSGEETSTIQTIILLHLIVMKTVHFILFQSMIQVLMLPAHFLVSSTHLNRTSLLAMND